MEFEYSKHKYYWCLILASGFQVFGMVGAIAIIAVAIGQSNHAWMPNALGALFCLALALCGRIIGWIYADLFKELTGHPPWRAGRRQPP